MQFDVQKGLQCPTRGMNPVQTPNLCVPSLSQAMLPDGALRPSVYPAGDLTVQLPTRIAGSKSVWLDEVMFQRDLGLQLQALLLGTSPVRGLAVGLYVDLSAGMHLADTDFVQVERDINE